VSGPERGARPLCHGAAPARAAGPCILPVSAVDDMPNRAFRLRGCLLLLPSLGAAGCWKDDYAEIPEGVLAFQPEGDAPLGWVVAPFEIDLECPDGAPAKFHLLYPEDADATPGPLAVLYHGGSLDYVFAPDPNDPLAGTHYANPSRLTSEWATREVFSTLGMYPDQSPLPVNTGALPVALVERGVPVLLPANCWGDLWASKSGGADNDFVQDFFFRQGRAAAEWAYRSAVDPVFAGALGIELPIVADPAQTYVIGLLEGGRGVAELLSIDNDADGTADYHPAAVLVDSSPDDLGPFYENPALFSATVEGLSRIFPEATGDLTSGSLASAPLPARVGYVYPTLDARWPDETHLAAVERLSAVPGSWVHAEPTGTGFLNGGGPASLTRDAVTFLLDGTVPP
jgi:hypothetical protein